MTVLLTISVVGVAQCVVGEEVDMYCIASLSHRHHVEKGNHLIYQQSMTVVGLHTICLCGGWQWVRVVFTCSSQWPQLQRPHFTCFAVKHHIRITINDLKNIWLLMYHASAVNA